MSKAYIIIKHAIKSGRLLCQAVADGPEIKPIRIIKNTIKGLSFKKTNIENLATYQHAYAVYKQNFLYNIYDRTDGPIFINSSILTIEKIFDAETDEEAELRFEVE